MNRLHEEVSERDKMINWTVKEVTKEFLKKYELEPNQEERDSMSD